MQCSPKSPAAGRRAAPAPRATVPGRRGIRDGERSRVPSSPRPNRRIPGGRERRYPRPDGCARTAGAGTLRPHAPRRRALAGGPLTSCRSPRRPGWCLDGPSGAAVPADGRLGGCPRRRRRRWMAARAIGGVAAVGSLASSGAPAARRWSCQPRRRRARHRRIGRASRQPSHRVDLGGPARRHAVVDRHCRRHPGDPRPVVDQLVAETARAALAGRPGRFACPDGARASARQQTAASARSPPASRAHGRAGRVWPCGAPRVRASTTRSWTRARPRTGRPSAGGGSACAAAGASPPTSGSRRSPFVVVKRSGQREPFDRAKVDRRGPGCGQEPAGRRERSDGGAGRRGRGDACAWTAPR